MNADGCTNGFRCVQCGFPIDTLYIQYSPGNIRLMKCEYCKVVADEYIECEVMILVIDLILHKPQAYRHLFYNRFSKETVNFQGLLWKSILAFLLLDIYRIWALRMNENEWILPATVVSFLLDFGKMFTRVVLENLVFLAVIIHGIGKLLSTSARVSGWKEVLLIVLISSYFKIFLMAMMVWKFPSSVIFIIDMFVISSNYVALKDEKMMKIMGTSASVLKAFRTIYRGNSTLSRSRVSALAACVYLVWNARNRTIFENEKMNIEDIVRKIRLLC